MASTKRFTTGGGFPHAGSPGREIEFTLSYGGSNLIAEHSGFDSSSSTGTGFDTGGLPSWMRTALAYRPNAEPANAAPSTEDANAGDDIRNFRALCRVSGP